MDTTKKPKPEFARRKWQHGRAKTEPRVTWSHEVFGSIGIDVEGFQVGVTHCPTGSSNSWTPVLIGNKEPGKLVLAFQTKPNDDILCFRAVGDKFEEFSEEEIPDFVIKVQWDENGVPRTRKKDEDNFNLLLLQEASRDPEGGLLYGGAFVVLQVSLVTREERFWVCIQELYVGQIALVGEDYVEALKAEKVADRVEQTDQGWATVLPNYPELAHPMSNPWSMFPECRAFVGMAARMCGTLPPIEQCVQVKWKPTFPEVLAQLPVPKCLPNGKPFTAGQGKPWVRGSVMWFNLVIGFGFVRCEDGRDCFVHFSRIARGDGSRWLLELGRLPVLQPGEQVLLKPVPGQKPGSIQATIVCKIDDRDFE